jgi:hypothetical protein
LKKAILKTEHEEDNNKMADRYTVGLVLAMLKLQHTRCEVILAVHIKITLF